MNLKQADAEKLLETSLLPVNSRIRQSNTIKDVSASKETQTLIFNIILHNDMVMLNLITTVIKDLWCCLFKCNEKKIKVNTLAYLLYTAPRNAVQGGNKMLCKCSYKDSYNGSIEMLKRRRGCFFYLT